MSVVLEMSLIGLYHSCGNSFKEGWSDLELAPALVLLPYILELDEADAGSVLARVTAFFRGIPAAKRPGD